MEKMCNPNKKFYSFLCMSLMFFCFNTNTTYAEEVCGRNYYVVACKNPFTNINVQIGTNLLKGFYYTEDGLQRQSPNYYDYYRQRNMQNLHAFFLCNNKSPFIYYDLDTNERHTVPPITCTKYRDLFLETYCPNKSSIVCAKCPNGGKTTASSISSSVDGNTTLWDLKSIADCYISKFTDSTGSYEYLTDINYPEESKQECRYAPDVPGDQIVPNSELYHQQEASLDENPTNSNSD